LNEYRCHGNQRYEAGDEKTGKGLLVAPGNIQIPCQKNNGGNLGKFRNLETKSTNPEPSASMNQPAG
jgi:hypothetical protein